MLLFPFIIFSPLVHFPCRFNLFSVSFTVPLRHAQANKHSHTLVEHLSCSICSIEKMIHNTTDMVGRGVAETAAHVAFAVFYFSLIPLLLPQPVSVTERANPPTYSTETVKVRPTPAIVTIPFKENAVFVSLYSSS